MPCTSFFSWLFLIPLSNKLLTFLFSLSCWHPFIYLVRYFFISFSCYTRIIFSFRLCQVMFPLPILFLTRSPSIATRDFQKVSSLWCTEEWGSDLFFAQLSSLAQHESGSMLVGRSIHLFWCQYCYPKWLLLLNVPLRQIMCCYWFSVVKKVYYMVVDIRHELCVVLGKNITSNKKWCRLFRDEWTNINEEERVGWSSVVIDELV